MVNCRGAIVIKVYFRRDSKMPTTAWSAADVLFHGQDSSDGQSLSDGRFCRMAVLWYKAQKISIKLLEKRHFNVYRIPSTWAEALDYLLLLSWDSTHNGQHKDHQ